jgi:predicted dehydrogenase
MRTLVVGYGSIGARHARLLAGLGCETAVVSAHAQDFPCTYRTLAAALSEFRPHYTVIANDTVDHFSTLNALSDAGYSGIVLVEKPLFSEPCLLPHYRFSGLWVGYNLRFHPVIRYVKTLLQGERVISANAYVGQYLPDWRPETDYRSSYSADAKRGGGALRDLSHELDFLSLLLGQWCDVVAIGGHFSPLEISCDDLFVLLIQSAKCPAITLQVSYLDRMPQRRFTINTERRTIIADLIASTVIDNGETIEFPCNRDTTYREMHSAVLNGVTQDLCSIDQAYDLLELIVAAEKSSAKKIWVTR